MTHTSTFTLEYEEKKCINPFEFESAGAIIVAAGASSRMGGINKILSPLLGLPVIVRTVNAFNSHPAVKNIVIVTSSANIADIQNFTEKYNLTKVSDIVIGGESRQESVKIGFEAIVKNKNIKNLLIHDGARPLISGDVIDRVLKATEEFGAAIPAVPLKDTVKKVGSLGRVEATPKRKDLVAVQTPQGFEVEVYKNALIKAGQALTDFTDDSSVVEKSGKEVYITQGDYKNIKITTPEDLLVAEAYLKGLV